MKRALATCLLLALPAAVLGQNNPPIAGIGPAGKITKLHTNFKFTEGPAADADGNVYFSDIPDEKIYKVNAQGELSTYGDFRASHPYLFLHNDWILFSAFTMRRCIE